ncbi:hypothetical protein CK203_076528 [Vitis vinifera]|uniref:Uncharacterized protein n=2 Tax=Vitis vinifera TaxID=29760 RepID=A0A438DB39_VITVI|nr:hypothetical protein CK203_076528 [Vitis vinifera]
MAPKKTVSSVRVSEAGEKAIDKLNAKEFRERFRIPHDVLIDLVNEEAAMPTEKGGKNAILFTKEQFNAGLRFPLPPCSRNSSTSLRFHPSSFIPTLSGVSAHLPSLQMVTELPDSTKGGAKGLVAVWGGWAGLSQHPSRPFSPNYTLKIPGLELRGHLVDWVEKASFACLKRLTLKGGESSWRIEIRKKLKALSGRLPDRSGVRTLLKENSGKGEAGEEAWEGCEGTHSSQGVSSSQTTYEGEVMIEEPVNAAPHSISSGPGRMSGLNHSGPSLVAAARLANVAEEAASINRPGNLNPDADAAETAPLEEAGQKAKSGLFERLQERQQEIEISCASAHDAHPDGGELPSASSPEEESADDAAPASPFSYAELEVKLKQITPDWKAIKPSAKMFDMIETLVRGLRSMSQQHDLFTQLLQTADYMRTFSSRHQEIENQLRLRMEEAEASLSTMREENEALRVELAEAKGREESTAGRLHEAEGEAARLRDELSRLRTEVLNEKKQKEDLQLRLDVQKEELEREFAVEREELAADYQNKWMIHLSLGIAAAA